MIFEEGCEGLERISQAEQRQKDQPESLQRTDVPARAQSTAEVEASLEKQSGSWLVNTHRVGKGARILCSEETLTAEAGERQDRTCMS